MQRFVVAEKVIANVTRMAEIVMRTPVPVDLNRHVVRVDDVAYKLRERYVASLKHISFLFSHRNVRLRSTPTVRLVYFWNIIFQWHSVHRPT